MTDRKAFEEWWKLLKPAECDEVEEHFRECWNVAINPERSKAPAWKDAPDAPGLWLSTNERIWGFDWHRLSAPIDPVLDPSWSDGSRYYGPIPEDKP